MDVTNSCMTTNQKHIQHNALVCVNK